MAEFGVIETLHASHGIKPQKRDFKVEVIVEGKIDKKTEYAGGVNHYLVIIELKKLISELEGKFLRPILQSKGYKTSVNESIAHYFAKSLKEKFPIKCVKLWEDEKKYAVVYADEV